MPKPLSPEQLETLQANGVIVPGQEAPEVVMPAGLVQRALGRTGLPNSTEVDQMDPNLADGASVETIGSESFREQLTKSVEITNKLMSLAGFQGPGLEFFGQAAITEAERTFTLYEQLGLEPDVVITREKRTLDVWTKIFDVAQNIDFLNPNRLLCNGGIIVKDGILKDNWNKLVSTPVNRGFRLEVVNGTSFPWITNVNPYGYQDSDNEVPNNKLNNLLSDLGIPEIPDLMTQSANGSTTLNQPECLPRVDTYLMQQLTRIASSKVPLDTRTWSWLKGVVVDDIFPGGSWESGIGAVNLYCGFASTNERNVGFRPSSSTRNA